jgi:type VI secretion system protein ImpA
LISVETLLADLSPESPCGDDLEYDPVFGEMERAAQGKPEKQFGGTIVPAEEPDWKEVVATAQDLLGRTKDLRVAVHLSQAALNTGGYHAFCECLALVRGYLSRYWEQLHPRLDPEDGLDPTLRVNLIQSLCDPQTTVKYLRKAPLVSSPLLGRFGLRELQIASGEIPAPANMETPPTPAVIDAAFTECDLEKLQATAKSVREAGEHVQAIETELTQRVGAGNSTSLAPLQSELKVANALLTSQLQRRGVSDAPADGAGGVSADPAAPKALTGDICSRDDVTRALDKICEYYARHEPSSPLPLLLVRAKRLVTLSFLEIIEDVVPDALPQARTIMGNPPAVNQ